MTSTTDRPVTPWPTRREREGGPAAAQRATTGWSSLAERPAAYVPRHAAADPEITERLPIVVPAQRAAPDRPAPPEDRPRPTPGPRSASAPLPSVAAPVAPAAPAAPVETPPPAPWRPAAATPCPPRPAVGSVVQEVRPGIRPMRNGLGLAAVCLGAIGLPLGLAPVTAFVAAGLGVLALAFGIAGWSRVRSGAASNPGAAVTGAVLGLIALGLGVAGTIAFVGAPDRLVYDVDAVTAGWTTAIVVTPSGE